MGKSKKDDDVIDVEYVDDNGNDTDGNGSNKKIKKSLNIFKLVIIGLIILFAVFDSYYYVNEQENAVVTMFGKVTTTNTAGLYFKIPFIQKVQKVDVTTHGTGVGYTLDNNGQNITDSMDGVMITSDFNLLNIDFYLEYKVSDPVAYLYNSNNPEEILKDIALSSIRSVVGNYTVDEAMTTAKSQIQSDVKEEMMRELEERNIGLQIINITVQDSEPPTDEIIAAFKSVETAKQGADTAKNNALQYQNKELPNATAEADRIRKDAEAEKATRIAEAEGQVARLNKIYEQYKLYPLITKKRMFYETMEEILPSMKIIITDGQTQEVYPLESFADINSTTTNNYNNDKEDDSGVETSTEEDY
ncbi:MAG: FtsH protease activity modulator HflK [Lachnospiraceae bacterium]|nr:FtsH protease activity modulator HflK [Lachnospiraceae bacterium]